MSSTTQGELVIQSLVTGVWRPWTPLSPAFNDAKSDTKCQLQSKSLYQTIPFTIHIVRPLQSHRREKASQGQHGG